MASLVSLLFLAVLFVCAVAATVFLLIRYSIQDDKAAGERNDDLDRF